MVAVWLRKGDFAVTSCLSGVLLMADSRSSFGFGDLLVGDFCDDGLFEAWVVEEPGGKLRSYLLRLFRLGRCVFGVDGCF